MDLNMRIKPKQTDKKHSSPIHESSQLHVKGEAVYTDDIAKPEGTLHGFVYLSPVAKAEKVVLNLTKVKEHPDVRSVITFQDILGLNNTGPVLEDEELLVEGEIKYCGQPLFAVAAISRSAAIDAASLVEISYQELPPLLTMEDAIENNSFIGPTFEMKKGNPEESIKASPRYLKKKYKVGGQDHFYLEGQVSLSVPSENGEITVYSSTQHPTETQHIIAKVLGIPENKVIVEVRRMGGGFGGKETQANQVACLAALMSQQTGKAVILRLDRSIDMKMTGKRHDFLGEIECGFEDNGKINGIITNLFCLGGWSADLSMAIVNRAMFHSDNTYCIDNMRVTGKICRTNTVSNTAFRGFGGPQGMLFIEMLVDDIAREIGKSPLEVRRINFYTAERNQTHYGQVIEDFICDDIVQQLEADSNYQKRRTEIDAFNNNNPHIRRGIALTPVKFGISFTVQHFNQASALVNIYSDGTVQLNHGGTEMGQGLFTKVAQVVAQELQIDLDQIRSMATNTGKVPNTSATAASSGSDLNGMAALDAVKTLKNRLVGMLEKEFGVSSQEIVFKNGQINIGSKKLTFREVAQMAIQNRVQLMATGHYATPKIHYDPKTSTGRPFFYYAYGAAVTEVVIDSLTGEYEIEQVDILHDCGNSLNDAIDIGQIEGAYIQGNGWLTTEELYWNEQGDLMTHAPSTYKIPTCRDIPKTWNVKLFDQPNPEETIYRSKAVGEPPFMLAISTFLALKDAIGSFAKPCSEVELNAPATPEKILMAIERLNSLHGTN